jgi:2'-5' RNA ligase
MLAAQARVRVFYALWPSPAVARALAVHARTLERAVGGRVTRTDSIHLTLVFVGDVAAGRLPELAAPPPGVTAEPFELSVDRLGVWRHNGIGWAAPGVIPPALAELQERLSAWVASLGFALEIRAFAPHVTLVRRGRGRVETADVEPIRWSVSEYVLVKSELNEGGARYSTVARFALGPGGLLCSPGSA